MALVVLAVVTGGAVFHVLRSGKPETGVSRSPVPGGFLTGAPSPSAPAHPTPPSEAEIGTLMTSWRSAILARDADTVMMCDRAFLGEPRIFTAALVASAESDPNERVRAFSTRVLGKFEDEALIPVFRKLLQDPSAFVRQNAAWSLGGLEARAQAAAPDLERVHRRDQAEAVRQAAAEALQRVRGSAPARRSAG